MDADFDRECIETEFSLAEDFVRRKKRTSSLNAFLLFVKV